MGEPGDLVSRVQRQKGTSDTRRGGYAAALQAKQAQLVDGIADDRAARALPRVGAVPGGFLNDGWVSHIEATQMVSPVVLFGARVLCNRMGIIGRKSQSKSTVTKAEVQRAFDLSVDGHVLRICPDPKGGVWLATGEGSVAHVGADGQIQSSVQVCAEGALSFLLHEQGRWCLGGMDGGLYLGGGASTERVLCRAGAWIEHLCDVGEGRVAAAAGRDVWICSADGHLSAPMSHPSTVSGLAYANGKLAVSRNGAVDLWTLRDGTRQELAWKSSLVSVCISPDASTVVAGCQDDALHFWRINTGEDSMMSGYPSKPKYVGFAQGGSWLVSAAAAELVLWRFSGRGPEGSEPTVLGGQQAWIESVAVQSGEFIVASGARDGGICLFRVNKGNTPAFQATLAPGQKVTALALDGKALWAGGDAGAVACFALAADKGADKRAEKGTR